MRALIAVLAGFLAGAAPPAVAEAPAQAGPKPELPQEEAKLRSFAKAFNASWEVRSRYAKKIEDARRGGSQSKMGKLQAKAQDEIQRTIRRNGLKVGEYLQLVEAGQAQPEALRKRLEAADIRLKGPIWAAPRPRGRQGPRGP